MRICPTITAYDPQDYKRQIERAASFSRTIHIDFMDGKFAETTSIALHEAWWPKHIQADLHIMHANPMLILEDVLEKHPRLVIVHDESEHVSSFVHELHENRIKVGIALLQSTSVEKLSHYINVVDHVLIFSGNLGHHGGTADLSLLDKVRAVKQMRHDIEIGWDGGINPENVTALKEAGVSVFDVGGYLAHNDSPESAYQHLQELLQ